MAKEIKISEANEKLARAAVKDVQGMFEALTQLAALMAEKAVSEGDAQSDKFLESEELTQFLDALSKVGSAMCRMTLAAAAAKQHIENLEAANAELTAVEKADTMAVDNATADLFANLINRISGDKS